MIKVEIEVRDRTMGRRDYHAKTRVYFSHADESILENFGNRMARPQDLYKTYLPDVAEKMGLPRTTKFKWSQYAGCSCPCSPGFVCDAVRSKDVFVTLTGAPKVNNNYEDVSIANQRSIALSRQLNAKLVETGE